MPKIQRRNPDISVLLAEILLAGRNMTPPVTAGEMARRVGISPETLSRMKQLGRGDAAVIGDLAAIVGFRLRLSREDDLQERMLNGEFFDD